MQNKFKYNKMYMNIDDTIRKSHFQFNICFFNKYSQSSIDPNKTHSCGFFNNHYCIHLLIV